MKAFWAAAGFQWEGLGSVRRELRPQVREGGQWSGGTQTLITVENNEGLRADRLLI